MSWRLNRFNWIAPYYDRITSLIFGKSIGNAQTIHLKVIPNDAKVLVLGGGSGKWMLELVRQNRTCKIWYIDASSKMIDQAKSNFKNFDQVVFIHGTENDIPTMLYDVVITHFFLDMFTNRELRNLINQLESNLKSNSIWIVSDFEESRFWHTLFLKLMYFFFKITSSISNDNLPDWDALLLSCGYRVSQSVSLYGKFIQCRVYTK